MFLGLIEKGFIVDIRKRTARSIWKGPVLKQALRKEKAQGRVRGRGKQLTQKEAAGQEKP